MLATLTTGRHALHFADLSQVCSRACLDTAEHCAATGEEARVLLVFEACSRLCRLSLAALTLDSELARSFLLECHSVCVDSARLCAALLGAGREDWQLESCAQVCLDCAESCETLLKHAGPELYAAGNGWRIRISTAEALLA